MNVFLHLLFHSHKSNMRTVYFTCILSMVGCMTSASVTNSIPKDFRDSATEWGDNTNGFCAGLFSWQNGSTQPPSPMITVYVLTSKTNANWNVLRSPGEKFVKMELRDTNGVIIIPIRSKNMSADLPEKILAKDLPLMNGVDQPKELLPLFAGHPHIYKEFNINDIYHIKNEGEYSLMICVAIYQFSSDGESVFRVDLPCVTTKIHLAPSQ